MATKNKKNRSVKESPKMVCQNKECDKMGKHQTMDNFYKTRNDLMPYHPFCKECVNKMVDVKDISTIQDVIKSLDMPFIMDVWAKVLKMDIKNHLPEYIKQISFNNRKKYENARFIDSVYDLSEIPDEPVESPISFIEKEDLYENTVPLWNDEWQGYYTNSDLKYLNNYYKGLNDDFKIVNTNHKDYARKIAQASLSQNKAYQNVLAGKDGADSAYEKATKLFDMLSKSAQFSENTRGANDVSLGCFGKVFDLVEKNNWVPKHTPLEQDSYDKMLHQFSNIERSL